MLLLLNLGWEGCLVVSQDCCNKAPRTSWLKTIKIYPCTFLEAGTQKSRQGSEGSRGRSLRLFVASGAHWQSLAFLDLQTPHSNLCLRLHWAFSPCACLHPQFSRPTRTPVLMGFGLTLFQQDFILTLLHL